MDADTIINENINIGVFSMEKQGEATIDVYDVYKKIAETKKVSNENKTST